MPNKSKSKTAAPSGAKRMTNEMVKHLVRKCAGGDEKLGMVKVDTDAKGSVKMTLTRTMGGDREMARTLFGLKPTRCVLVYCPIVDSSSTNTAQAPVHNLDPTQANEWSSFAAIFDEARVMHTKSLAMCVTNVTGASGLTQGQQCWAMCFDPAVSGAVASVGVALEHTKQAGPVSYLGGMEGLSGGASAGQIPSLLSTSTRGGLELTSGPLMKGAVTLNSGGTLTPNPVQGDWFPTTSTTAIAGYVKFYCEATGASTQTVLRCFHWLYMEFRMRG